MGGGSWLHDTYASRGAAKAAAGKPVFDFDADTKATKKRDSWTAHEDLSPFNVTIRESRDSDEHPTSTPVAVLFDVTGSMGEVPILLQKKLPTLFGLLLRKGYISDPQIMVGGIGDATIDRVPLQISQFESDNRIDENLEKLFLEEGGGGQKTESYELALYFMARHTVIDCYEKRGRKGYLFIIGDELAYSHVKRSEVTKVIGDSIEEDITTDAIMQEVKERYHVFYLHPEDGSYVGDRDNVAFWTGLLGQNYIQRVATDDVCETIASLIGVTEGIDLAEVESDLVAIGVDAAKAGAITKVLGGYAGSTAVATVAPGPALPPPEEVTDGGAVRI